jgi:nitrogen regulatory protein P-II 1
MKKIEAIIRPERLDLVKEGLEKIGVVGLTVTQVNGRGRQKGITLQWRAGEYRIDLLPKVKIEIVLADEEVDRTIKCICELAKTGKEGDGMIFVLPVENAIRVRTSDSGSACISTTV